MSEEPNFSAASPHYCTQCGTALDPGSRFCSNCGAAVNQVATGPAGSAAPPPLGSYPQQVPNYLVPAILVTIFGFFCCFPVGLPAGIVAIVFAAKVNGKLASGDYAGAVESANQAKTWAGIAFGVTLLGGIIWVFVALASSFFAVWP